MASDRYSVGSLGSLISSCSDGVSVDSSFMSLASTSSSGSLGYEIESEVGREALKEICCSALSRVLDFPDCQLETLLGYDEENDSGDTGGVNVAKNITASLRSMKRGLSALYHSHHAQTYQVTQVSGDGTDSASFSLSFGSLLNESSQAILLELIMHIKTFVSREGLFRKSGNKGRMDLLVKGLEGGHFREVLVNGGYNAHDFASVLKQYFSELPEPLLLKRHLNAYLQAAALFSPGNTLRCLQLLMLLLPPVHRVVLQHLLDLLFQVTRYPDNKMDSHNLSLILAPTLFLASRSESLPPEDFRKLSQLLAYMIDNCEDIFEVPSEVQVVAERYCRKRSRRNQLKKSRSSSSIGEDREDRVEDGNDLPIDLYSTSCKRECVDNFHETGKDRAMDEVAKLYELVKNMPDGPQKTHFMKRFESASKLGCTPSDLPKQKRMSSLSRLKRSLKRNKENATPKISGIQIQLVKPCFKKGSLLAEFDEVDSNGALTATSISAVAVPDCTPCKSNKSILKPPIIDFKTPTCSTPEFKTPGMYKMKMIPTNSSMVTDV